MPENHSANGRLDSWKEIADYLNRDSRTAMRWEQERGMPVHRVPGGKRQAVFAFKQEIDGWLLRQQPDNGVASASGQEESPNLRQSVGSESAPAHLSSDPAPGKVAEDDTSVRPWSGFKRWRLAVVAIACLLLLTAFSVFLAHPRAAATVHPFSIVQVTNDGRNKLNLRTDGTNLYFNELEVNRHILVSAPVAGGPIRPINTTFANVDLEDISKDGRSLLVTSFDGIETERPLWIIPAQGGPGRRIGNILCRFARWSPDNSRIACANGTMIMSVDAEGSVQRTLGPFPGVVSDPLWSPDGKRLMFVLLDQQTIKSAAWEVTVGNDEQATQSTASKLPWGQDCCEGWAWMEDGKTFVYNRSVNKAELYVQSPSGDHDAQLPISIGSVATIAAGRNGAAFYLLIGIGSRGQLLTFDAKQENPKAFLPGLSANLLSFSRDGQWMTYTTIADASLWRSRADGSERLQLTKPPMEAELSSWSPDGRRIAFMGRLPGKPWRILLIGLDGGPVQEAAPGEDQQGAPTWSADGKFLAYGNVVCQEMRACWIRVLNLSTGQIAKLPGSHGFRSARWSPDGRYIAALQPETHQLMLFDLHKQRWSVLAESITGDNPNWSNDSRFIYVDNLQGEKPAIERIRVPDGQRATVVDLSSLQDVAGGIDVWFGLTPKNEPILYQRSSTSEVYALSWTDH